MTTLEFDDYGYAHVSESKFFSYLAETAQDGDYTKEKNNIIYYYNSAGCLLAEYDVMSEKGKLY